MNTRRPLGFLVAVLILAIPACSQVSVPATDTTTHLKPQAFGTPAFESANGLAKYSSGVYVVGSTSGNLHGAQRGKGDAFVRKVSTRGEVIWGRQFGTLASDVASYVATDAGGNAYVFGRTSGNLARTLRGTSDFFIRKYTPSGGVAWTKQMGLDTADYPRGVAVSGNSVYVVGTSQGLGTFVYRFNLNGGTLWKKQFSTGSSGDVAVDGGGNAYVAGSVPVTCDDPEFEPNCANVQLNKYNASGNLVWTKRPSFSHRDTLQAVAAHGGSVYLVNHIYDLEDHEGWTYLVKLDSSGAVQWDRDIGVTEYYDSGIQGLRHELSADGGGAYIASTAMTNFVGDPSDQTLYRQAYEVTKFSSDGSMVWRLGSLHGCCGSSDTIYGYLNGVLARGGEVYIAGAADRGINRGYDAFVKRLDATTGSTVWK